MTSHASSIQPRPPPSWPPCPSSLFSSFWLGHLALNICFRLSANLNELLRPPSLGFPYLNKPPFQKNFDSISAHPPNFSNTQDY